MVQITIDKAMREKLFATGEVVVLVDESGQVLGRVLPEAPSSAGPPADWVPITPVPSEEELKRLSEYDGPGISTDELLARLRDKK
ncbi:hypothetical protein Pla108_37150 [Botrimarina colliarenosi]|uniref:Uncharacterized protein n=1 Tax=Botrimarina colliarenosi TaxID=2528001 RepID=A0A5C6A4N7_9BACT|nr:hypothetical protein [Botrimarina colliarenosi]TWT94864.1 hypothetical protein Pla108_37150 [Botrimarina colliarenosi]